MWILILTFVIGLLIGIVIGVPITLHFYKAGTLVIDQSDLITDKYSFEIDKDLAKLPREDYISMRIKVINERPEVITEEHVKKFLDVPEDETTDDLDPQ